nr:phenylalanine-tRNA ligase beta subunit [Calliblepharis sp.]
MKFSWKWLNEIADLQQITLKETIEKLTLAGFEIEEFDNKQKINDITLDLSITTNRSDATSIIGLARELNIIFKIQNFSTKNKYIPTNKEDNITYENINIKKPKFLDQSLSDIKFTILKNLQFKRAPEWLINNLKACDIIPENTLFNIIQYIRIKWGQDIEIFDIDKIEKQKFIKELITIKDMKTSSSNNYKKIINLSDTHNNTCLKTLNYKDKTISLLGIKSNTELYCNHNTSSIIILGHICKPHYIQKTTNELKYKTKKSQKHIKGLSRNDFLQAYDETIHLIIHLTKNYINKASNYKWHTFYANSNNILIDKKKVEYILGPVNYKKNLNTQEILDILNKLNFKPADNKNAIQVTIPEYRHIDIKRPIDIVEEIGRIYGFNHFIDQLPKNNHKKNNSKITILIKKVRNILRQLGLYEVIHYSIDNTSDKLPDVNIFLYNPLQKDQTHLRNNLIYNLLKTLKYNNKQKNAFMECFEIGKIFEKKLSKYNNKYIYTETIHVAGIIGKTNFSKRLWSEKGKDLSWFQAKGLIEILFEQIHSKIQWKNIHNFKLAQNYEKILNICHPYKCAILLNSVTQEIVGIFGELNIKCSKTVNNNQHNYFFELNLLKLIKTIHINKHLSYISKIYSNYPSVTRDISLTLNKNTTVSYIKKVILSHNTQLINSVKILNEYYLNKNINGSRNISFRIIYKSKYKTLNDYDIKKIDNKLKKVIKNIKIFLIKEFQSKS